MSEVLGVRRDGGVLTLTLDRPERRNALNFELAQALLTELTRCAADPSVRVVVLTGAGGAFCSGDDLSSGSAEDASGLPLMPGTYDFTYVRIAEAILHCPKPVVAAVDGVAAGAGMELACAADLRIASDRARFGSKMLGIAQVGGLAMLGRVVGPARATEIYLSDRFVDAHEALALGLADQVSAHEDFAAAVDETVARLAVAATGAVGVYKQLRERMWGRPAEVALRLQNAGHARCNLELEDTREGVRAFLERRPPRFTGR